VNPLIDSADRFETAYTEVVPQTAVGRRLTAGGQPTAGGGEPFAGSREPGGESDSGLVTLVGKIRRINLEGGFWGFTTRDGSRYDPLNLPPELQKEGQLVKLWVKVRSDVATTHMWGTPVHVVRYALPGR
jgi:hypothetical protein